MTLPFAPGSFEYYISAVDSGDQIASSDTSLFDVGQCIQEMVLDDGSADGYSWANESSFEWAVKVEPEAYPFVLCGVRIAVAATEPGSSHSSIQVRILDNDGVDGLPGTELWNEITGSIGNQIGGVLPGPTNWARVIVRDEGAPLELSEPFYISVRNPIDRKYEAFGHDLDSAGDMSFFFDGCDMEWHSEMEVHPNAQGGARMIRPVGYSLDTPTGLTIQPDGFDIVLRWNDVGAPAYRIMKSASSEGEFLEFAGSTTATTFTDSNALQSGNIMFYHVQSVPAP